VHGEFVQRAGDHINKKYGCPKCSKQGYSKAEQEISSFIASLGFIVENNNKSILKNLELDIVIPEKKIAIEYNGLYWHSEQAGKATNYHLNKTISANSAGYRLIHIFEDEWSNKKDIVKNRLTHILGVSSTSIYARKLDIREVSSMDARNFFNAHHLQGMVNSRHYLGLFEGNELVSCMSFSPVRFEDKENGFELMRFASSKNVVGGFSRLLKNFLKSHPEIKYLVSYADKRWSEGSVYEVNGFNRVSDSKPGYFWCNSRGDRFNRVLFQKHKLQNKLTSFDSNKTEKQNCIDNGYFRVFDCGTSKWVLPI
jgi:hypothetical protein